jgi:FMN reductase (NADPH)
MMNDTIRLLTNHRSIRKYKDTPVSREMLSAIIDAAQMASSSSSVQAYSIIHVTDPALKQQLAVLSGNPPMEQCPLLLIWCADMNRLRYTYGMHGDPAAAHTGTTENMLVAAVDTALAAQNAAVAAESLGLGIVYIGGIRNEIASVSELLGLPEHVFPVFGICMGFPDQEPVLRPRLPQAGVLHENRYDAGVHEATVKEYDRITREYMRQRSGGKRDSAWSEDMHKKLDRPLRSHMKAFLHEKKFMLD